MIILGHALLIQNVNGRDSYWTFDMKERQHVSQGISENVLHLQKLLGYG
jgi:hypothetical protein